MAQLKESELKKQIKEKAFVPLYFLYGEEKYLISHYTEAIAVSYTHLTLPTTERLSASPLWKSMRKDPRNGRSLLRQRKKMERRSYWKKEERSL